VIALAHESQKPFHSGAQAYRGRGQAQPLPWVGPTAFALNHFKSFQKATDIEQDSRKLRAYSIKRPAKTNIETRRIRAIRLDDSHKECERRLSAFGLFGTVLDTEGDSSFKLRIARALRSERRAARAGGAGYDPLRHLILSRLDRQLSQRKQGAHR
jgi:hypothetical protein